MDITTHRAEYLRLAKVYLDTARPILEGMHGSITGWFSIKEQLAAISSPGRASARLQDVGWALADRTPYGRAHGIGRALVEIGECCMRGGYTDLRALERLRELLKELQEDSG